jgi:hypothetical protein
MIVRDDAAVGSRSLGEARDAADNDAAARAARLGSGADVIDLMASVSRGGSMRRILMVLATALSMVLLVCGVQRRTPSQRTSSPHLPTGVRRRTGWLEERCSR